MATILFDIGDHDVATNTYLVRMRPGTCFDASSNAWFARIRNIDDTNTRWILIAGNGAETTLEAEDMFKKGDYLKGEPLIPL